MEENVIILLSGVIVTLVGTLFRQWVKNHEEKVDQVVEDTRENCEAIQELKEIAAGQREINKAQMETNDRLETLIRQEE